MKALLNRISLLAAIALLAAACTPEEQPTPTPTPSSKDEIKITSGTALTVLSDGGTATVQFTSSGKWTAAPSNDRAASWLTISPSAGEKGDASITLTVAKNEETDDRSATIRISCGSASASVTLTQKQKDALTQTPSKTQFEAEGGSFTIEVKSNVEYSFEIDSDWIHRLDTKALTTETTSFTVDKNEDTRKREGAVTVKSPLGSEKITVYQEAAAPSIILSSENVSVKTEGGTFTVDVNTNVDVAMAITTGAEWLSEVTTKAMSTHSYTFLAAPNEGYDAREGKITFRSEANGLEATVTVTQMQKDALVVSPSVCEIGANGGNISIEATTNVELSVKIARSWVHQVSTKSLQTLTYNFTVDPNPGYDVRECVITFSGSGLSQTVTIRQDGADGFIADFQEQYTLSAMSQTLELKAKATVDIAAESHADWITVVSTKALSDKSVTLQIAENKAEGPRTGKVTISAPALDASETVTIVQVGSGDIYIPDDAFRTLLLAAFDTDGDGVLSKEECKKVESINLNARENPSVQNIASLQGIEYFDNLVSLSLCEMTSNGAMGKLSGTVNLSANSKLWDLHFEGCDKMEVLDINTCTNLRTLYVFSANNLREVVFPDSEGLFMVQLGIMDSKVGPELDLSIYPDLDYIYLEGNPNLKKLWLTTGLAPQNIKLDPGCTIAYKGENPNVEAQFKDQVLKEMMMNSPYFKLFDWDGDGVFSYRELERIESFSLWPEYMDGMDESKVITSFEDIAMLKNLKNFMMSDFYGRITAPIPDCIGDLKAIDRIIITNTNITGPIPESVCTLEKLLYLDIENTQITGPLPEGIGGIPNLKQLKIVNCPNLDGPIPESLITGPGYDEMNFNGCNFDDTYIVVPSSRLLDHTRQDNDFSYLGGQVREYALPGGGTYWEYPNIYYRSEADGQGAVHADGEVELYHAATKGPGLDIIITGDGFTAENNTVGGTLETYMKHIAEMTLSMEPYNKLEEYFNVWLVYAHSEREGTGIYSTDGLKFRSYQVNPANSTVCVGDNEDIVNFVKQATGRYETSGTVAVIMNSSHYGGTCYWPAGSMYDAGMAVTFNPTAWAMDLTYVHETLGHGFGHLEDEYDAQSYSPGIYYYPGDWAYNGWGANMDGNDPVRWSSFINDSRYAAENLGAYVTSKPTRTYFGSGIVNYFRPTQNSVMRTQWDEGGNRFNAPSREAIWQRVYLLAHPEENWSSWEEYVNNGYNREEFVQFDLTPASSSSRARAPRVMRSPERTLPDGRKVGRLPPPTPPVVLNLSKY